MESFELVLVLLACVIIAAVAERVIRRVSLPLVQIAVGLAAAPRHTSHVRAHG